MSAMPNNPYAREPDHDHNHDHDASESDSKPLLDHTQTPAQGSDSHLNPVYEPDYRYSYTDEHFNYYPSGPSQSQAKLDDPFTPKPEDYARQTQYENLGKSVTRVGAMPSFSALVDYADPVPAPMAKSTPVMMKQPNMFQRYFGLYPLEQRIQDKKRGVGVQRHPIACTSWHHVPVVCWSDVSAGYVLSAAMLGVLIFELVTNSKAQGSPFSFKVRRP